MNVPRKFTPELLDHAQRLFSDTRGLKEVAAMLAVNPDNLSKALRSRGFGSVRIKRAGANRQKLPSAKIAALYIAGMSELELSKQFGIARNAIRRRLLEQGCEIRGQSDANITSMARMTSEQRKQRAEAAHAAIRNTKRTHDELVKRAITKESQEFRAFIGPAEDSFANALAELGIEFTRQKRVDVYNLDFAIGNVAVELKAGAAHDLSNSSHNGKRRIKQITEAGYSIILVCFKTEAALMSSLKEIVAHIDFVSRNPTTPREYWVVGCAINRFARFRDERGQFAAVAVPEQFSTTIRKRYLR